MKVSVKELNAAIELKTKGMALEVLDNNGALQGSLIVTGTGVRVYASKPVVIQ